MDGYTVDGCSPYKICVRLICDDKETYRRKKTTTNRDWLSSLSPVDLVNWIKNTAAAMSHAELLRWMEEKHENLSEQKRARN